MEVRSSATAGTYTMDQGLFACSPEQVPVWRYAAPNTVGRVESEEAAARLVFFCRQAGLWCGMGARNLADVLEDYAAEEQVRWQQIREYQEALKKYDQSLARFKLWSLLTLGFSSLFKERPIEPKKPDLPDPPMTVLAISPQLLFNGFAELVEKGLCIKRQIDGEEGEEVVYPTPSLIRILCSNQRVTK